RDADLTAPEGQAAGDGTDERALAGTRGPPQDSGLAARQRKIHAGHERLTVGAVELEARHGHASRIPADMPDATVGGRLHTHALEGPPEASEPLHHRAPVGDVRVRGHDEAQRVLHLPEGGSGLDESAEGDRTLEEARGRHDEGEDNRRLAIAGGEPRQSLLLTHDAPPVPHHGSEALAEAAELVGLAAVEGHALGVLAEADEAKA